MKNMYEEIKRICEEVGTVKALSTVKKVTIYRNKTNKTEFVLNLDEAIEKKVNFADYEKVEIERSLKPEIFFDLFGKEDFKITPEVKKNFILFNEIVLEVTKATRKTAKDTEKANKKAGKEAKETIHAATAPIS